MNALVRALGLAQVVTRFASLARRSTGIPAWFLDWVAIEREAVTLHTWQPALIPGLLQTPEYARAILASWRLDTDGDIEAKLAARIDRQAILDRGDLMLPCLSRRASGSLWEVGGSWVCGGTDTTGMGRSRWRAGSYQVTRSAGRREGPGAAGRSDQGQQRVRQPL